MLYKKEMVINMITFNRKSQIYRAIEREGKLASAVNVMK